MARAARPVGVDERNLVGAGSRSRVDDDDPDAPRVVGLPYEAASYAEETIWWMRSRCRMACAPGSPDDHTKDEPFVKRENMTRGTALDA